MKAFLLLALFGGGCAHGAASTAAAPRPLPVTGARVGEEGTPTSDAEMQARGWAQPSGAVTRLQHGAELVAHIYAEPLKLTELELEPGEVVVGIEVGDQARWIVTLGAGSEAATAQRILVKPAEKGLETSATITTDRRDYRLELHSEEGKAMRLVRWVYRAPDGPGGPGVGAAS
jgi:type IV secretion system protein TrbG